MPLFYYILHLYLLHLAAGICMYFVYGVFDPEGPTGQAYGFSLPVVYLAWILVVLFLYPLCRWYADFKVRKNWALLRYL